MRGRCVRTMRGVSSITMSVDWAEPLENLAILLEAGEQVRLAVAEAQAGHDLARAFTPALAPRREAP